MFSNLKIGVRLGISYVFMLLIIIILMVLSFTKMANMKAGLDQIVKSNYVKAELAFKASSAYDTLKEGILALIIAQTPDLKARELKVIEESRKNYRAALDELKKHSFFRFSPCIAF